MSSKKQTAVEWLIQEFELKYPFLIEDGMIKQAKAIEKKQIIRAFCEGYDHDGDNYDRAEIKYYTSTYGS
jgi:hypothetical protein